MRAIYLAQDDRPTRRRFAGGRPQPGVWRLWLLLLLPLGLGLLGGWVVRDWQFDVSEGAVAAECQVCQEERPAAALLAATRTLTPTPYFTPPR